MVGKNNRFKTYYCIIEEYIFVKVDTIYDY